MGTAQTVPNAEEQVGTTLFQVDFVVWTITATCKTILFVIWFLHAYFNVNLIPIRHEDTKVLQTKTRTIEVLHPNASHTDNCSSPENMSSSRSTAPVASVQTDLGTPCMQSSQSKEATETSVDAIMAATSKETEDSPRMNALGRFYIT
eukprot:494184_1